MLYLAIEGGITWNEFWGMLAGMGAATGVLVGITFRMITIFKEMREKMNDLNTDMGERVALTEKEIALIKSEHANFRSWLKREYKNIERLDKNQRKVVNKLALLLRSNRPPADDDPGATQFLDQIEDQ